MVPNGVLIFDSQGNPGSRATEEERMVQLRLRLFQDCLYWNSAQCLYGGHLPWVVRASGVAPAGDLTVVRFLFLKKSID
jgi:hypothetical protein